MTGRKMTLGKMAVRKTLLCSHQALLPQFPHKSLTFPKVSMGLRHLWPFPLIQPQIKGPRMNPVQGVLRIQTQINPPGMNPAQGLLRVQVMKVVMGRQTKLQLQKPNQSQHPEAKAKVKARVPAKRTLEEGPKLALTMAQKTGLLPTVMKEMTWRVPMVIMTLSRNHFHPLMLSLRRPSQLSWIKMPGKDGNTVFLIQEPVYIHSCMAWL
jgi:hypothetical protein